MGFIKAFLRIFSVAGKEIVEVFRRPGAVFSLVLGPFLILAIFGFGYGGFKKDLQAIVVIDPASSLPQDAASYQELGTRGLAVQEVTNDRGAAEAKLKAGLADVVIVAPLDPEGSLELGQQAELTVLIDTTDPVAANYAAFLAETMSTAVNREIYRRGAEAGQTYAITIGGKDLSEIPPDVIASPTKALLQNLAPVPPSVLGFYGPAALALVLQHLAVTLIALSIVRERSGGALDRFRSSPLRATELVLGKVAAFGLLGGAIAALSLWLLVNVLGVPMIGAPGAVAGIVIMLLIASLGLGLLISVISDSERQAVQLSLLTLLASMFFSGFVLRTEEFAVPVQVMSYFLPVTHGISLLQEQMLTGVFTTPWQLVALGAIGAVLLATSWLLLRRELRPA